MKRLFILFLTVVVSFTLFSCQDNSKEDEIEEIPTEIFASFNSVEDLKIALKKNPELYNDKRVSVKGYAEVFRNQYVWLFDDIPADDELWDDRSRIKVIITDSVKLSVLEDGDYIDLNGVITISTDDICMEHCTYSMLYTNEEQHTDNQTNTSFSDLVEEAKDSIKNEL